MGKKKFSSKLDEDVMNDLRAYATENRRNIADVLTEAVRDYLDKIAVRPVFKDAADEVISENDELLKRLAK